MAYLDRAVTDAGGIALRYGGFYGAPDDKMIEADGRGGTERRVQCPAGTFRRAE
jgi:hypothetical protein